MLIFPRTTKTIHGNIVKFMCKVLKCFEKTPQDNDFVLAGDSRSFRDHLYDIKVSSPTEEFSSGEKIGREGGRLVVIRPKPRFYAKSNTKKQKRPK